MVARRSVRKSNGAVVPIPPYVAPVPPFIPEWATRDCGWVQHESKRPARWMDMVLAGELRIPRFQRSWKWTDEQILLLLDSVLRGDHVGSLLLWERYNVPASTELFGEVSVESKAGRCSYVIDGQQRLSALVTAVHSGRFFLDLERGKFVMGAGIWRLPLRLAFYMRGYEIRAWGLAHITEHGMDVGRLEDCICAAIDTMNQGTIGATILPYQWTAERVVETFGRMNSTGTPFDPEELRAALAKEAE